MLLPTGSLPSLLGRSTLPVAELRRLLAAAGALLAGLVSSARGLVLGRLLVPGRWRPSSCPARLATGRLATSWPDVSLSTSLVLAFPGRALPWGVPATTRLAGVGGRALLSAVPVSSSALLDRWLSADIPVPSSTVLSAPALAAAVLMVHVVARPKVRGRANKRRPPFTWTGAESPC